MSWFVICEKWKFLRFAGFFDQKCADSPKELDIRAFYVKSEKSSVLWASIWSRMCRFIKRVKHPFSPGRKRRKSLRRTVYLVEQKCANLARGLDILRFLVKSGSFSVVRAVIWSRMRRFFKRVIYLLYQAPSKWENPCCVGFHSIKPLPINPGGYTYILFKVRKAEIPPLYEHQGD